MHRFDIEKIKRDLPINMIIDAYNLGGDLKKRGAKLMGACPVHGGDNKTAFHVDLDRNIWNCFTRNHGGSNLDLIMEVEGCDFPKSLSIAVSFLNDSYIPEQYKVKTIKKEKKKVINKPLSFRLSLNPHHPYFTERSIKAETAKLFGAGYLRTGKYSGTICFPILNYDGDIAAYSARNIDPDRPKKVEKYKVFPYGCSKSSLLYNIHRVKDYKCRDIIITEGFFDLFKMYQYGYTNVVSLLTAHMSDEQAEMLISLQKRVILILDGDKAGRQGTEHALDVLKNKIEVMAVHLPYGAQPDSMNQNEVDHLIRQYRYSL